VMKRLHSSWGLATRQVSIPVAKINR
jgi:hypothetical protein